MLGSSIAAQWKLHRPDDELIELDRSIVDLRDRRKTLAYLRELRPDSIVHAAAVVGGIAAKLANPTRYLLDNLLIDSSVIGSALETGVPELLFIGSAAVYPETYRQPFIETDLLAAPLEQANEGYAIAKIAGIKLCEYATTEFGLDYRVAIPSNLYGPNDNHSLASAHLIAAALSKVRAAYLAGEPEVIIWGDGTARREFTYGPDLAEWVVSQIGLLSAWPSRVNVGFGIDYSIDDYYSIAADVVGYGGRFRHDLDQPAGMHERILDSSLARGLGWAPHTSMQDGMAAAYKSLVAAENGAP